MRQNSSDSGWYLSALQAARGRFNEKLWRGKNEPKFDKQHKVIREVALARFSLPLPEHQGQELEVRVALIRDWRRLVPKAPSSEEEDRPLRWDEKPDGTHEYWLDENWQATPLSAPPMEPKLIPIVTTAAEADAV